MHTVTTDTHGVGWTSVDTGLTCCLAPLRVTLHHVAMTTAPSAAEASVTSRRHTAPAPLFFQLLLFFFH